MVVVSRPTFGVYEPVTPSAIFRPGVPADSIIDLGQAGAERP